jgi:uncharacterized protein YqjF (DUF2071 family)
MAQTWRNLLFVHWEVDRDALRAVVPGELPLDTYEGKAFLAVTPFAVRHLHARLTPPLPLLGSFPEINVRTYVTLEGRPGIHFFSLDAASKPAVAASRLLYRLPYFPARMRIAREGAGVRYDSQRELGAAPTPACFQASYEPSGAPFEPEPGSLEHWLTERYCLYTFGRDGAPQRAEIHHRPWQLQVARARIERNTMALQTGLALSGEPLLHYAERQDVVFWTRQVVA